MTVELLYRGQRVASHVRSQKKAGHTTSVEHMPKAHREYVGWTVERITIWAAAIGPMTSKLVATVMASKKHAQQSVRACLGILRLSKSYGPHRLEAACERAVHIGACSYKSVLSILKSGLDQKSQSYQEQNHSLPIAHENIRGAAYYH